MEKYVSILVPTKDRPQFKENILNNYYRQSYNSNKMELIIMDDGNVDLSNYFENLSNISYFKVRPMTLGEKRNKLIKVAKGDILIFFDDDDYYPKDKVSECVNVLENSNYLITGSSIMYIYFPKFNDILKYGPSWHKNHATCATLAFKKEYCKNNKFPHLRKAEERKFLNNYKSPLYQMNPFKSILVIGHNENTVNKYNYRDTLEKTDLNLDDFGMSNEDKLFYKNLI